MSKIVIGRSNNKRKWFAPKQNFVERLTQLAPNMDIYIIPDTLPPYSQKRAFLKKLPKLSFAGLVKSLGILVAATAIGLWFYHLGFSEANIITVYLLSVLCTALVTNGWACSALNSVLSVIVFNFFFTVPRFTLQAYDTGYPVTFVVMLIAAFMASTLAMRVKDQARQSARKAYRTEVLLETSQKLQRSKNRLEIYREMASQMIKLLDRSVILYPVKNSNLGEPLWFPKEGDPLSPGNHTSADERAVAQWVYKNNKHAGASTNTLPGAKCRCV